MRLMLLIAWRYCFLKISRRLPILALRVVRAVTDQVCNGAVLGLKPPPRLEQIAKGYCERVQDGKHHAG